MKKARPQLAPVHSGTTAGAAVLTAPTRRRVPRSPRSSKAGGAGLSAPSPAEAPLENGSILGARSPLGAECPALPDLEQPVVSSVSVTPAAGPLPPEEVELKLLLEALYLQSGVDFRNYRRAVVQERVAAFLKREHFESISVLQAAVLRDPSIRQRLLVSLTERQTPLFDDPGFYRVFRTEVVPWLRTYPFARIWVAGCNHGGEAFSLAAVLLEEGLQDRCRIYATDLCEGVIQQAQAATCPLAELKRAAVRYRRSGGQRSLAEYYTSENKEARVVPALTKNIVFAAHSLLTDASFNEFHLIVCRAVLDDFDHILETQVHDLLYGSLVPRGVLALGRGHNLSLTLHQSDYEPMDIGHGLYRKKWPQGCG